MKKKLCFLGCLLVLSSLIPLVIVTAQTGEPVDPYEGYNDINNAWGPLLPDRQYAAYLSDPNDYDFYWFKIEDEGGTIQVDLTNVSTTYNYAVILYGPDQNMAAYDQDRTGEKHLISDNAPSGLYKIVVWVGEANGQKICYPYQPYLLRFTFSPGSGVSDVPSEPLTPQPGSEVAWARAQLESYGYTVTYDPVTWQFDDGSTAAVAFEKPKSANLRLSDPTTSRQAIETWAVLLTAFDVDYLWVGLEYMNYMVYYVVNSDKFHRYIKGEISDADLTINVAVQNMTTGEFISDAKDFVNKNFQ